MMVEVFLKLLGLNCLTKHRKIHIMYFIIKLNGALFSACKRHEMKTAPHVGEDIGMPWLLYAEGCLFDNPHHDDGRRSLDK